MNEEIDKEEIKKRFIRISSKCVAISEIRSIELKEFQQYGFYLEIKLKSGGRIASDYVSKDEGIEILKELENI